MAVPFGQEFIEITLDDLNRVLDVQAHRQAVEQLPDKYRAVMLSFYEPRPPGVPFSSADAASKLGITREEFWALEQEASAIIYKMIHQPKTDEGGDS